jgi:hypothetical protein
MLAEGLRQLIMKHGSDDLKTMTYLWLRKCEITQEFADQDLLGVRVYTDKRATGAKNVLLHGETKTEAAAAGAEVIPLRPELVAPPSGDGKDSE